MAQRTDSLTLFARDLCGNEDHWKLIDEIGPSKAHVEVAELLHVPGFVIHGTFKTEKLNPGFYQVALIVKIGQTPTNTDADMLLFHLCQTNSDDPIDFKQDLHELPRDEWVDIPFAECVEINPRTDPHGQVHFLINKMGHHYWDENFLVNAVVIKPANAKKLTKKPTKKSG